MRTLKEWWNRLKYYTEPETFSKAEVLEMIEKALAEQGYKQSMGEMVGPRHEVG